MMITDPIGDLLTRIRNASLAKHQTTYIPFSKLKFNILKILLEEGFVKNIETMNLKGNLNFLKVDLLYSGQGKNYINEIKRCSKPGRRMYLNCNKIPWIKNGFGLAIISTSSGLMTDKNARKKNLGGELICTVW